MKEMKDKPSGETEAMKQENKEAEAQNDAKPEADKAEGGAKPADEAPVSPDAGTSTDSAEGEPDKAKELTPEEQIAALQAQLAEAQNNYLRKAADFENFRKRKNAEQAEAIEFANKSLLLDIIPTIDNFERAIKSAETVSQTNEDFKKFYDGVALIEKQLSAQLESKWGLKRFDSEGQPFDPNKHEALMMETSPDATEEVVKEDLMKGYTLKDKVIRTAKVKVLKPA
jgi:molecular chaperone GrpE